jgi:hypothetical protein
MDFVPDKTVYNNDVWRTANGLRMDIRPNPNRPGMIVALQWDAADRSGMKIEFSSEQLDALMWLTSWAQGQVYKFSKHEREWLLNIWPAPPATWNDVEGAG